MHSKVILRFQRKTETPLTDDMIRISDDEDYLEMYKIEFRPGNGEGQYRFYLPLTRLLDYLTDVFRTMSHDADPFEYLQVDTQMHPTVLYHISDLDDPQVRHLIEGTIEAALIRRIRKVKTDLQE